MQAGVGNYVADARPEEAARTLASIEATSRAAMREMRRLVGVLRDDQASPELAPAHGLADVGQLLTGTADAGVRVQLEIRGRQHPFPPGVDLAAYRIVQEALTNVVKHAQTTASRVLVTYADDAICLEITDAGHGAPADSVTASAGHGIAGMPERVSLFGGDFHAGPLPGGASGSPPGCRSTARRASERMIRVLVADDQALVRGSVRLLVDTAPDLEVIGEAATGAEAVEIAAERKPDVLLMDIRMPGMDGIEATRQITGSGQTAAVRMLILTTFDLDEYVYAALRAGASGFLLKDTPPADLLAAIRIVAVATRCWPRRSPGGSSPSSPAALNPARYLPGPWKALPTGSARS